MLSDGFFHCLILPLLNSVVFRPGICLQEQYLKKSWHFVIWIFSGLALGFIFLLTYKQIMLFWSIAAVAGLVLFVAVLILILVFAVNLKLRNTVQSHFYVLAFLPCSNSHISCIHLTFILPEKYCKPVYVCFL